MIVEIIIIILSILFLVTSWITNSNDGVLPDKFVSNTKKETSQIDDLLGGVKTEKTIPKKETSQIDDLLGGVKTEKTIPKKETSQIDDLLGGVKTEKTIPKKETIKIECPGCSATMELQKTGKMQDVVCDACGLKGELEV
jgi:CxxC motif-containing protein